MNKIKILLMAIIFIGTSSLTNAQYLHELKLNNPCSQSVNTLGSNISAEKKYPVYAGVISFIVPGFALGQLYNGQPDKFLTHLGITSACVLGAVLGLTNLTISVGGNTSNENNNSVGLTVFFISAGVFAGNLIWSVVDAVISADKINERAMLKKSRSDILNKLKFGFKLDKNKSLNLKLTFEL